MAHFHCPPQRRPRHSRERAHESQQSVVGKRRLSAAIAALMRQSGEAFVQALGIKDPLRALDLGCGDGTTAIPLAQLGADVLGVDIARNLVDAGNRRAAQQVSID